jgi:hypothetical protein
MGWACSMLGTKGKCIQSLGRKKRKKKITREIQAETVG